MVLARICCGIDDQIESSCGTEPMTARAKLWAGGSSAWLQIPHLIANGGRGDERQVLSCFRCCGVALASGYIA